MRFRALLICFLVLAACVALNHVAAFSAGQPETPSMLYTAARKYSAIAWMRGGERFPLGAVVMVNDGKAIRPLASGFSVTADPNVSFDGKSVLFAGKRKPSDPWQIWEIAIEGGEPRQVVSSSEDAVRPMYLPEDRLVYARKRDGQFVIEAAALRGGEPLRLTYAPGSALPTDVLRDGRILFEAGYPLGSGSTPELYTVYSDGSGVESYRCDHGHARYSGKQVASGDIVFTRGRALSRFTSPLAHEVEIAAPAGEYAGDVIESSAGDWIVSWRADAGRPFELARWKPGETKFDRVVAEAGKDLIQPALAGARPVPNRHPSGLHDWKTANLLTLNTYTSKYQFAEGAIASVRLYTVDGTGKSKVLGTAPVEKDGSMFIQVTGNQPLKFELLDAAGKTLKKQDGWMWTRAGEQRACVGCHAGPERAPENAVPAVLQRSTTPADLTGTAADFTRGGH